MFNDEFENLYDGSDKGRLAIMYAMDGLISNEPNALQLLDMFEASEKGDMKTLQSIIEGDLAGDKPNAVEEPQEQESENAELSIKYETTDAGADDSTTIRWASERGNSLCVRILLSEKVADPSSEDNFAIRKASEHGHLEIVQLLLNDKRVDPSAQANFAIRKASTYGHLDIVKLLLNDKRVDPSAEDNFAIRKASENGHSEVVNLLLKDKRVDPNALK